MRHKPLLYLMAILVSSVLFLSNSFNPPNARTGGPGEGLCSDCHSGGSFNGNVSITGIPTTVQANQLYNVELTISATSGSPASGGFQLVALNSANENVGTLIVTNGAQTGTNTEGGRTYMEHRGPKSFSGNTVTWEFDWEAPAGPNNEDITFYFVGNMVNGNGGTSGDAVVNTNFNTTLQGAADPIVISIDQINPVTCNGFSDGSITASASGGNPPLTFEWSNGLFGQTISGLSAGTYQLTVSDVGGQTATAEATVTEPQVLVVAEVSAEPFTCNGPATIVVEATGGTPNYVYNWSDGTTGNTIMLSPQDLPVDVTVTDDNDCTAVLTITTIPQDNNPPLAVAAGGTLTCSNPSVTLSSAGSDQGPCFEFAWTDPQGNFLSNMMNPVVNMPGTYNLVVTNICNGCTATADAIVLEDIESPVITISGVDTITCNLPVVEIDVCGLQGILWNWTTNNGNIVYGADSCIVGVNAGGTYVVTATDTINGCIDTAQVEVFEFLIPNPFVDSIQHVSCFGEADGYVLLGVNGGQPPLEYLWPDSSTLNERNDLSAGSYAVSVTDSLGCIASINITITQPAQILANLVLTDETAPDADDGTATVSPQGGMGSFEILWSTGDTTNVIEDLAPGQYCVTITDSIGCSQVACGSVQPFGCALAVSPEVANVDCHGDSTGSIQLSIENGVGPVEIIWNTGQTEAIISNLPAGTYTATISDSLGCSVNIEVDLTEPENPISVAVDSIQNTKGSEMDGGIFISPSGGSPSYSFEWTDTLGVIVGTAEDLENVGAGTYTLVVTDDLGCSQTFQFMVGTSASEPLWMADLAIYPNPVSASLYIELPTYGQFVTTLSSQDGVMIHTNAAGSGQKVMDMSNLPSGVYLLRVLDEQGGMAVFRIMK